MTTGRDGRLIQGKLAELQESFDFKRGQRARAALSEVMRTDAGREALFWILDQTGLNAPKLWTPSAPDAGLRLALRDLGKKIEDEMTLANEPAFFDLQRAFRVRAMEERLELENEERKLKERLA